MSKDIKQNPVETKNKSDLVNEFTDSSLDTLLELVKVLGIKEDLIPDEPTKEQLMGLIIKANRNDIAIAKSVQTADGKEHECPPGHMVIRVTPKALGMEWGARSREVFFFAINGECVVGKRGATVVIPDKYRSCWRDAIQHQWTVSEQMTLDATGQFIQPAKWSKTEVPAEDVNELYWNRDYAKEKADELDLIEGSKKYLEDKNAEKQLRRAMNNVGR